MEAWRQAHPEVSGEAVTLTEAVDMGRRLWGTAREKWGKVIGKEVLLGFAANRARIEELLAEN